MRNNKITDEKYLNILNIHEDYSEASEFIDQSVNQKVDGFKCKRISPKCFQ